MCRSSSSVRRRRRSRTSPLPMRVTEHRPGPSMSTSPLPSIENWPRRSTVSSTSPEPADRDRGGLASQPVARTSPDPSIDDARLAGGSGGGDVARSADREVGLVDLHRGDRQVARSAIAPSKLSPSTRSTRISPRSCQRDRVEPRHGNVERSSSRAAASRPTASRLSRPDRQHAVLRRPPRAARAPPASPRQRTDWVSP